MAYNFLWCRKNHHLPHKWQLFAAIFCHSVKNPADCLINGVLSVTPQLGALLEC